MKKVLCGVALMALAVAITLAGRVRADDEEHFDGDHFRFFPGNLVVSRTVYDDKASNVTVGEILPPNCASTTGGCSASTGAPDNGAYPTVFNDNLYDGSFGLTSKIFLDQMTPFGWLIDTLEVPSNPKRDHMVTSFSSKSELALHLSTDGKYLSFMGYVAPIDALDLSNANTPGAVDPTNPVGENVYRAVALVDEDGKFKFTETNAYSGNNGRAAILSNRDGANFIYTAGNAGNGANPQPPGVIIGAGAQIMTPSNDPESAQVPGTPTPVASFNVLELPSVTKADKTGKDDNFRGMTIFDNVLYYTKGSGSNGIDTVYFVDTTGTACPTTSVMGVKTAGGVGLPVAGATLPTIPVGYSTNTATLQANGLNNNMCVLAGFTTTLAKTATTGFPFGLWFANKNTLYVADEGDGVFANAGTQTTAGLQKWVFNSTTHTWNLAYTLHTGLELGVPYTVPGYPTGNNAATGLAWSPETDGLRNITGRVEWDGKVTIWGITSTVSGNGDQGADPNRLVAITDLLDNTDPTVAAKEEFHTLRTAGYREVLRGVSFTPRADGDDNHDGRDNRDGRDER